MSQRGQLFTSSAFSLPSAFIGLPSWRIIHWITNLTFVPVSFVGLILVGIVFFALLIWCLDLPGLFSGKRPLR